MADKSAPKSVDLSKYLKAPTPAPTPPITPAVPAPVAAQFRPPPPPPRPTQAPASTAPKSVDLSRFLKGGPPPPAKPGLMTPAGQVRSVVEKGQAINRAIAAPPPMSAADSKRAADTAALFSGSTAYRPSPQQIAAGLPPPPPPETMSESVRKSRERMLSDAARSGQEAVNLTTKGLTQAQRAAESAFNLDLGEAAAKATGALGYGLGGIGMGFDAAARAALGASNIGPAVETLYGKPLEEATANLSPGVVNLPRIPIPGLTQLGNVAQSIYESATDSPVRAPGKGWSYIGGPLAYDPRIPREFPVEAGIQIGGMFTGGEVLGGRGRPRIPEKIDYNAREYLTAQQIAAEAAQAAKAFQGATGVVEPVITPASAAQTVAAATEAAAQANKATGKAKTPEAAPEAPAPVSEAPAGAAEKRPAGPAPFTLETLPQQLLVVAREFGGFIPENILSEVERRALAEAGYTADDGFIGDYTLLDEAQRRHKAGIWTEGIGLLNNDHIPWLQERYGKVPARQAPDNWPADVPRTVFHGYGREDQASVYGPSNAPILGPARYSAFDAAEAGEFGPNVVEGQATSRNPLVIRNNEDWNRAWQEAGYRGAPPELTPERVADLRASIEGRGHDGVVVWFDPMADVDAAGKSTKRLREAFGGPQVVEFGKTWGPVEPPAVPEAVTPDVVPEAIARPEPDTIAGVRLPSDEIPGDLRPRDDADYWFAREIWDAEGRDAEDRMERGVRAPVPEKPEIEMSIAPTLEAEARALANRVETAIREGDGQGLLNEFVRVREKIEEAEAADLEGLYEIYDRLHDYTVAGMRTLQDRVQAGLEAKRIRDDLLEEAAAPPESLARPAPAGDTLPILNRPAAGAGERAGVIQPSPEPARTSDPYNVALTNWNEIGRKLENDIGEGLPMPARPERPRLTGMADQHPIHGVLSRMEDAISQGDGQALVSEAAASSEVLQNPRASVIDKAAAQTALDYAYRGMEHLQGRVVKDMAGENFRPSEAADLYTMADTSRPKTVQEVEARAQQAAEKQQVPDTATPAWALDEGLAPPRQASPEELARIINGTGFPGSRTPDPRTPIPPLPKAVKTPQELARDLADVVGVIVRRGRIRFRNALGVLNTRSHIIRMKEMADFDVVAHEVGHALEFKGKKTGEDFPGLRQFFANHKAVLELFTYAGAPANLARVEGFAEWLRLYMTNPDLLRQYTANTLAEFELVMGRAAPDVLQGLRRIQAEYDAYIKADPVSIGMSRVAAYPKRESVATKLKEAIQDPSRAMADLFGELVYGMVSNLNPLRRQVNATLKVAEANIRKSGWQVDRRLRQMPKKVTDNPFDLMEALPGAANRGQIDVTRGIVPYGGTAPHGPSLIEALAVAEKGAENASKRIGRAIDANEWLDRFDAYLIARRMVKQWDRHDWGEIGRPDLLTRDQHQALIDAEEAMFPEWVNAAQMLYDMQGLLWAKLRDAGIMSDALYQQTTIAHPDYVPTLRDMTDVTEDLARDIENFTGMSASDALENLGKIAGFKGSQRNVLSPTRAIFEKIMAANLAIAKNDVHKALLNISRLPGSGELVEQIPRYTRQAISVSASEMAESVAKILGNTNLDAFLQGVVTQAIADADGMTVWRAVEDSKRGQFIIHAWENGVRHDLRLPGGKEGKRIYDALTGMDRLTSQVWLNIMAVPGAALRSGVVMHPTFALTNLGRDMVSTAALTNVGYLPGYDNIRMLVNELRQGDAATRYRIGMGIVGGERAATVRAVRENNDILRLRKAGFRIVRPRSIGEALRMIPTAGEMLQKGAEAIELAETTTRLSVFDRAEQRALARGLTPYEAMMEASLEARRVIDFDARGAWGWLQGLQIATPFLRANLQGLRSFLRVLTPVELLNVVIHNTFSPSANRIALTEAQKINAGKMANLYQAMTLMAALDMSLRVMNKDNPVYDEMDDLRRQNWVIPVGDKILVLPKPFEMALMGNLMARFYEGVVLNDPTAGKEAWKDAKDVLLPPLVPQTVKLAMNIARNRDDFGNPIVPEGKRQRLPEDQYGERTNPLAIQIARVLAAGGIHWSPAMIDYVARNSGGYASRDIMNGIEAVMTPATREAFDATKAPVLQRFWKDPTRMATGSREFWGLARAFGGELTAQQQSFQAALQMGDIDRAQQIYNRGDPWDRAYLMATAPGIPPEMRIYHPMVTAPKVVGALGDMTTALSKGNVTALDGSVIDLTPEQRRDAMNALAWASLSIKENALHDIAFQKRDEKPSWPYQAYLRKVYDIDPRLYQHLNMMVANEANITLEMLPALRTTYRDTIAPIVNRNISRADLETLSGVKRESTTTRKKLGERLREVTPP